MRRRTLHAFSSLFALAIILLIGQNFDSRVAEPVAVQEPINSAASSSARVARVVDGDTIELEDGSKVRYIGVNTPESVDPRRPVGCFGKEASAYNKSLVSGKVVQLVGDVGDTDKYGRLLRYVYLEDGTFVNLKLVQDGYASVMTVPPNVKYRDVFVQAEREAREKKMGLWSKCGEE